MFTFFQRHQKIVFIFIALFMIVPLLFFGISSKPFQREGRDPIAFTTFSGTKVKRSELERMKRLLLTNAGGELLYGNFPGAHFFPHNVFAELFVATDIVSLLAEKYERELRDEFAERRERYRSYRSYVHPRTSFLNAKSIWEAQAPRIAELTEKLRKEKDDLTAFTYHKDLFAEERKFPPIRLWQALYERGARSGVDEDPSLVPQSLGLYGYRTTGDWFGEVLTEKAGNFIFQAASFAGKKGYRVSFREAERDLVRICEEERALLKQLGTEDFATGEMYLRARAEAAGMHAADLIRLWQKVLVCRTFLQDASSGVILDHFTLDPFEKYASKTVCTERYSLPKSMECKDFGEIMQLEAYWEALGKPVASLSLDFPVKDPSEPDLIEKEIGVLIKEVHVGELALSVPVQTVAAWKRDPKNREAILRKFPAVKSDDYEESLKTLDARTAHLLDLRARKAILGQDRDWLSKAFEKVEPKEIHVKMRKTGKGLPFRGMAGSSKKNSVIEALFSLQESFFAKPFTFDEETYYQILSVKEEKAASPVSLEEARKDGTLEKILKKKLQAYHRESAYAAEDFDKVRRKVAAERFAPLKEAIREDYVRAYGKEPKYANDLFYAKYRFYAPLRDSVQALAEGKKEPLPLFASLERKTVVYDRSHAEEEDFQEFSALLPGEFSSVRSDASRQPEFFRRLPDREEEEKHAISTSFEEKLRREAVTALATELLDKIVAPTE